MVYIRPQWRDRGLCPEHPQLTWKPTSGCLLPGDAPLRHSGHVPSFGSENVWLSQHLWTHATRTCCFFSPSLNCFHTQCTNCSMCCWERKPGAVGGAGGHPQLSKSHVGAPDQMHVYAMICFGKKKNCTALEWFSVSGDLPPRLSFISPNLCMTPVCAHRSLNCDIPFSFTFLITPGALT